MLFLMFHSNEMNMNRHGSHDWRTEPSDILGPTFTAEAVPVPNHLPWTLPWPSKAIHHINLICFQRLQQL